MKLRILIPRDHLARCFVVLLLFVAWDIVAGPFSFAMGSGFTFGTASQFDSGDITRMESAYLDTNKFVVCYAASSAGQCRVATVSGTAFTWGAEVQFNADVVIPESLLGACQIDTNKFAVVYGADGSAEDGFTIVATVAGDVISFGAAVEFSANIDADSIGCAGIATDKWIIGYNAEGTSDTGTGVACTAAGTVITCGALNDYAATDYYALYNSPAQLDTDKFVMAFNSQDNTAAYVVAGTTATRTITWGGVTLITNDNTSNEYVCTPQDADRFVVVYNNETGGAGEAVAGTTAGTNITLGAIRDFNPTSQDLGGPSCAFISATRFVVAYPDLGAASYSVAKTCDVNWTTRTIQCGGQKTYAAMDTFDTIATEGQILNVLDGYGTTDVKFVAGYHDASDTTTEGYVIIGDVLPRNIFSSE